MRTGALRRTASAETHPAATSTQRPRLPAPAGLPHARLSAQALELRLSDGSLALASRISARGMDLLTQAHLHAGQSLTLELHPPGWSVTLVAEGVVARVRRRATWRSAAVRFTRTSVRTAPPAAHLDT